jgi:hypothetical protein
MSQATIGRACTTWASQHEKVGTPPSCS